MGRGRVVAQELGIEHEVLLKTTANYKAKLEAAFGLFTFETEKVPGGRPGLLLSTNCHKSLS